MIAEPIAPQYEFAANFGKLALQWRESSGLSIRAAAARIKMNATHLESIEEGWTILSLKDIAKVAQGYGKRVVVRFLGEDEKDHLGWDFEA